MKYFFATAVVAAVTVVPIGSSWVIKPLAVRSRNNPASQLQQLHRTPNLVPSHVLSFPQRITGRMSMSSFTPSFSSTSAAACAANSESEMPPTEVTTTTTTTTTTSSSRDNGNGKVPTVGSIVTIECDLRPQDGWIPDVIMDGITLHEHETLRHRLTFQLGNASEEPQQPASGFYPLPGLHQLILTKLKTIGDYVEASIDAGWGERNPNFIVTLRKEDLQQRLDLSQVQEGSQLVFLVQGGGSGGGQRQTCMVTQITDDTITIDANPPLAGSSYLACVKLISVEDAPDQLEYVSDSSNDAAISSSPAKPIITTTARYEVATFALGCFWGVELAFMRLPGVVSTRVGYTQGWIEHPTYEQVCSDTSGHVEAIQIIFDPEIVLYTNLVQFAMDRLGENKYRLNQVENDRGTQYRHGIYYHNDVQKNAAKAILECYGPGCVTECLPATKFWAAEAYHQQYLYKGGQSAKKGEATFIRRYG